MHPRWKTGRRGRDVSRRAVLRPVWSPFQRYLHTWRITRRSMMARKSPRQNKFVTSCTRKCGTPGTSHSGVTRSSSKCYLQKDVFLCILGISFSLTISLSLLLAKKRANVVGHLAKCITLDLWYMYISFPQIVCHLLDSGRLIYYMYMYYCVNYCGKCYRPFRYIHSVPFYSENAKWKIFFSCHGCLRDTWKLSTESILILDVALLFVVDMIDSRMINMIHRYSGERKRAVRMQIVKLLLIVCTWFRRSLKRVSVAINLRKVVLLIDRTFATQDSHARATKIISLFSERDRITNSPSRRLMTI